MDIKIDINLSWNAADNLTCYLEATPTHLNNESLEVGIVRRCYEFKRMLIREFSQLGKKFGKTLLCPIFLHRYFPALHREPVRSGVGSTFFILEIALHPKIHNKILESRHISQIKFVFLGDIDDSSARVDTTR